MNTSRSAVQNRFFQKPASQNRFFQKPASLLPDEKSCEGGRSIPERLDGHRRFFAQSHRRNGIPRGTGAPKA